MGWLEQATGPPSPAPRALFQSLGPEPPLGQAGPSRGRSTLQNSHSFCQRGRRGGTDALSSFWPRGTEAWNRGWAGGPGTFLGTLSPWHVPSVGRKATGSELRPRGPMSGPGACVVLIGLFHSCFEFAGEGSQKSGGSGAPIEAAQGHSWHWVARCQSTVTVSWGGPSGCGRVSCWGSGSGVCLGFQPPPGRDRVPECSTGSATPPRGTGAAPGPVPWESWG